MRPFRAGERGPVLDTEVTLLDANPAILATTHWRHIPIPPDMRGITQRPDGSVHVRLRAADGKTRERTFKGAGPEANLRRAKAWRAKQKGEDEPDALPEGITRRRWKTKNGTYTTALVARVAAWADPDRPRRTFPGDALDEAVEWLDRANAAREAGLPLPEPTGATTPSAPQAQPALEGGVLFGVAARAALAHHYAESIASGRAKPTSRDQTFRELEKWLIPTLGSHRLEDLTRERHIAPLRDRLAEEGYTTTYQSRMLWMVTKTYQYSAALGWCSPRNPADGLQPRVPTEEAAKKPRPGVGKRSKKNPPPVPHGLMSRVAEHMVRGGDSEYAVALLTLRYTGLRIGELFGLTLNDIHPDRRYFTVTKQRGRKFKIVDRETGQETAVTRVAYGKTAASRRLVPIIEALWPYLEKHIAYRLDNGATSSDPLFLGRPHLVESSLHGDFRKALEKASYGLLRTKDGDESYFLPHDLRHALSTDLFYAGVPDPVRAKILGHRRKENSGESTVTTITYEHTYLDLDEDNFLSVEAADGFDIPTDHELMLTDAAEKLNLHVKARLGGAPLMPNNIAVEDEWVTVAEAATILGRGETTVRNLVKQGRLPINTNWKPNCRRLGAGLVGFGISRAAVEQMSEERGQFYSVAEAARLISATRDEVIPPWVLSRLIEGNGLPFFAPPKQTTNANAQKCISKEDFQRLVDLIKVRDDFLEEHWHTSQLLEEIGADRSWLDRRVTAGLLTPVTPPVALAAGHSDSRWFNRNEVLAVREATKAGKRIKKPRQKRGAPAAQ